MADSGKIVVENTLVQIQIERAFATLTLDVDWSEIDMWWRYAMGELEEAKGSFGGRGAGTVFIVPSDDRTIFRVDADGAQQTISVTTETARRSVGRSILKLAPKTVTIDDGATSFSFALHPPSWSDWRSLAEGAGGPESPCSAKFEGRDISVHLRVDGGLAVLTCSGRAFRQKLYFLAWHARESIARSLST